MFPWPAPPPLLQLPAPLSAQGHRCHKLSGPPCLQPGSEAGPGPQTGLWACSCTRGLRRGREPAFPPRAGTGAPWTCSHAGTPHPGLFPHNSEHSLPEGVVGPCLERSDPRAGAQAAPTQLRHPEDHDLAASELGVRPQLGAWGGSGRAEAPDVGDQSCILSRQAEPPETLEASEGFYCPLLLAQGGPAAAAPRFGGREEPCGGALGLGLFLPAAPPKCLLIAHHVLWCHLQPTSPHSHCL